MFMNSSGAALLNGALIGAPTIVRASRYSMAAVLAGVKTSALHLRQSQSWRLVQRFLLTTSSWPCRVYSRINRKTAVYLTLFAYPYSKNKCIQLDNSKINDVIFKVDTKIPNKIKYYYITKK